MVSNLPSMKRSLSLTRVLKNVSLTGQTPLWSSRICSRAITKQPGNRCFMSTSQSLLMQWYQDRLCKIIAWKKVSIEQLSSSFSKCWTRKILGIGSIFTCSPAETTSSRSQWCNCQSIIFDDSKRWFGWQKLFQWETCIHPTRCYSLSGSTCPSTERTGQCTSRAVNVLATRSSLSQSTLRAYLICR